MNVLLIRGGVGPKRNPSWRVPHFFFLLVGVLPAVGIEPVRRVDFTQTPEIKELAGRARQIGNEMYPQVLQLLTDDVAKMPRQFDITFKKDISLREDRDTDEVMGYVRGRKRPVIYLNAEWFAANPTKLDVILIHEMAHLAQQYSSVAPSYWREGIADYAPCKLGYTNGPSCPKCSNMSPHYKSGYACAAAFLLYVDATYGSNVVRQLNTELRRGSYSDTFFAKVTGRSLDQLWAEFQNTPAFTPSAAEANKFFKSLGYVNGTPPKGKGLLDQIKQQPGGALTLEAGRFLYRLGKKHQLPGFRKGESGDVTLKSVIPKEANPDAYPVSRTFDSSVQGASSVYNYVVFRASQHSAWKLQRAWRSDRDGRVIEEYPVP